MTQAHLDTQLSLLSLLNQPTQQPQTPIANHPPAIQQGNLLSGLSMGISEVPTPDIPHFLTLQVDTQGLSPSPQHTLPTQNMGPLTPYLPSSTFDRLPVMVLDLETTGLNPKKSHLIELTVMRYVAGVETDRLSSLINPLAIIPPEVESLTGITPEMVKDAPHAAEVLRQFVQFITQDGHHPILCGHNIMFDLGFLVEKLQSFGISQEPKTLLNLSSALDTLTLAKKLIHLPSYEGIAVGGFLGVINHQAHRAEADVIMAAGILYKLFERLPFWQGHYNTLTLQDILAFQGPLKTRL